MKFSRCLTICYCILSCALSFARSRAVKEIWNYDNGDQHFEWQLYKDQAKVSAGNPQTISWKGSLLPAFWLVAEGRKQYIKAVVEKNGTVIHEDSLKLQLRFGGYGTGSLTVLKKNWGISFSSLQVNWSRQVPAIIEMYYGTSAVSDVNSVQPNWERPFMPDWQAAGFCVPGAKGGTVQSFFRMWDFGQASVALGGFGPALGSPYGAAYPRPLYYFAMGTDAGFTAIGAGSIPDAPMLLRVQATSACLQYIYREDLWGPLTGKQRTWDEPLRITLAENAYGAFRAYYASFPSKEPGTLIAPAVWNTWGDWREKKYPIKPIADFAKLIGSDIMVLDDPWESSQGSGKPNTERFPHFFDEVKYIKDNGMKLGLWETVGWISRPEEAGLTKDDLLIQKNGKPCKANWNFSPWSDGYYCLDISSTRTREFIRKRTVSLMQNLRPGLLKLDFGYGFPGPSVAVARNPAYRGERFAYELVKLIAQAAKSVNPDVIIMYYSISPLWFPVMDLVSLDDQGDLWYEIKAGHQQWSIWSSLAGAKKMAISGSSGYDWSTDDDVLLNTAVIGSPGAVLPTRSATDSLFTLFLNRRLALSRWHRKTVQWNALWLNSNQGNLQSPPTLQCFGRMEEFNNDTLLTAVALRDSLGIGAMLNSDDTEGIRWSGRWALIAQDQADIRHAGQLAVIPFENGRISIPYPARPTAISVLSLEGESSCNNWLWNNGRLELEVGQSQLAVTAGFLIKR